MFRFSLPRLRSSRVVAQFLGSVLLAVPLTARAADLELKFEPGVAFPLSTPQSDRFKVGGAGTLKGIVGPEGGWASLAASLTFVGMQAKSGFGTLGATAWAPGIGFRLQPPRESEALRLEKPHAAAKFWGVKPWLDGDLLYVRTGGLDRAGFAVATGLSFPIGEARSAWLGPFVRYLQVFQGHRDGYQNDDSKTIIAGLSLELGTRSVRPPSAAEPAPATAPASATAPAFATAPAAVAVSAPAASPAIAVGKVVIRGNRLETKDKIQFLPDHAILEPASYPMLDQVAKVLRDNPGFKVQLEGRASSEGAEAGNQPISAQRAQAVLDYLADRGVARDRLVAPSSPKAAESSATEANRRVDYVVSFIILKEESAK